MSPSCQKTRADSLASRASVTRCAGSTAPAGASVRKSGQLVTRVRRVGAAHDGLQRQRQQGKD